MHVPALGVVVLFVWMLYMDSEQFESIPRKRPINIGFIIDQGADSMKRAYNHALALSHLNSNATEIRDFISLTNIADSYLLTKSICSLLRETVFTIIGAADIQSYDAIESYGKAMQVPVIIYNDVRKIPKEDYKYLLHITPSYIPAIVDFVKYHKWRTVFYLHDENDPLWPWRVSELFSLTNISDHLQIIQRHLDNPYDCHDQLRHLDQMPISQSEKIFIVDMSNMTVLELVMKQVTELGMNRDNYHYILGGMDIQSFGMTNFIYGGVRITGFQLIDRNNHGLAGFLESWNRKNRYENGIPSFTMKEILLTDSVCFLQDGLDKMYRQEPLLFQTRAGQHYNTLIKEVICRDNIPLQKGPIIIDFFKNTSTMCLSGQVSFNQDGYRTNYNLDVHSLGYKQQLHKVGRWSSETGYTEIVSLRKPIHKREGAYIVTVVVEPPFVVEVTAKDGTTTLEGYCIDMLRKIANSSRFHLHYRIQKRNDNAYGNNKTGVWDGMIGDLINGTADIALGSITITEIRQAVVDFTKPFMDVGISIMIKRPDKQKPNVFSFKEPFSNKMWICIMFGFGGVSLVLVLIGRFSPYEWQNNSTTGPSDDFSVLNSLWSSFGALLQQGSDFLPSSVSGRIAECAWWFFTLIIVSSYTANLAAFLTIERLNIPISSADDLIKQSKIKYGFKAGGSTDEFFKSSTHTIYKQMYDFMEMTQPSPYVDNNTQGWERVLAGKSTYAYLVESTVNEYFNQKKPCKTMKVGPNLNQNGYGIATRKGSKLSEPLNLALLELRETGELINLKQRWWYDKGQCGQAAPSKGKQSLSLSNVAGTFHIVIAGLILAMIFSGLEFLFHFKKKQRKDRKMIKTVIITDTDLDIEESKPLKTSNVNGAQDNKGYQTATPGNVYQTSPANLIMFDSITDNGQTML